MSNPKYIGPKLPPNFLLNSSNCKDVSGSPENSSDLQINVNNAIGTVDSEDDDDFGPALPPGFQMPTSSKEAPTSESPADENDDDDDVFGPVPEGQEDKHHQYDISTRKSKKESDITKREKWMLEPGKAIAKSLTLQAKSVTKFNQKSSKKDTPLTKEQKLEQEAIAEKEGKMREFLDKYEKSNKRAVSLLEKHRKDMNKNKKAKTEKKERKEFDRDTDLNVPRMDSKMKNSFLREASSTFSSRFSGGKFEKFL